jgi:hypothetical protein
MDARSSQPSKTAAGNRSSVESKRRVSTVTATATTSVTEAHTGVLAAAGASATAVPPPSSSSAQRGDAATAAPAAAPRAGDHHAKAKASRLLSPDVLDAVRRTHELFRGAAASRTLKYKSNEVVVSSGSK